MYADEAEGIDRQAATAPIRFRKAAGRPVTKNLYPRLDAAEDEDAAPKVMVESGGRRIAVELTVEQAFRSQNEGRRDNRGRHLRLRVPDDATAGAYTLHLPNATGL